jgi:hypothetical protein
LRLLADRRERFLRHADYIAGRMDLDPSAVERRVARKLRLDGVGAAHQLNPDDIRERGERLNSPIDLGPGAWSPPIASTADADHAQASSTSTCFLPAVVPAGNRTRDADSLGDPHRDRPAVACRATMDGRGEPLLRFRGASLRNSHGILKLVPPGALAPAGIEIGPASGTEARAIVAAEEEERHR